MRLGRVLILMLTIATGAVLAWPSREVVSGRRSVLFTVWGMPFEDRLYRDRYARGFEALHPGVEVDYRRFGEEIVSKYNAWHARGFGPEVMRLRITDYPGMAARGMLLPLDNYLAASAGGSIQRRLADVPEHLRRLLTVDGKFGRHIYALPEDNAQYGLYYNKRIFDDYNEAHPADRVPYPDASWTWDDLRAAARKLTTRNDRGGGAPGARGGGGEGDDRERGVCLGFDAAIWSWPFMALLAQAGGAMWSEDGARCVMDSDAGVRALEFLRAMQREDGSFVPSLAGYNAGVGPDALFAAGRTAMLMDGSWRAPDLEKRAPELDFAVAPLPRGRVPAVVSGCVMWGISAHAVHPDDGWAMLDWLTAPAQALEYWDALRVAPPASLAVLRSDAFKETRGILAEDSGKRGASVKWEVLPMPREKYADRAAWLSYANTPDPATGKSPGFVPVHPYQTELEEEITRMLNEYLSPSSKEDARAVLGRAAEHIRRVMERDAAGR